MTAVLLFALCACQPSGTRPIIKIGLSAPFSGFDESVGYSVIGVARMAVRERNQVGLAGYAVELVALDDANEPEAAAQRAREMIIDPAVVAVLGGFDGAAALAAAAEYEKAAMPFLSLASCDALNGRALRLVGWEKEAGWQAGKYATNNALARRIAVVSERSACGEALSDAFITAAQTSGATIAYRGYVQRWQLDFTTLVQSLAMVKPDLVFFAGRAAEAGEFLRQLRAAGVTAAFLGGPDADDTRLAQIAGPAAQGAHTVSLGFALSQVSDRRTQKRLADAGLRPAGAYTVLAYDGMHVLLDAVQRAIEADGKPSRSGVATMLHSSRYLGVSGEIGFDAQGNRRVTPVGVVQAMETLLR
jgi:branched-chain amino acid transport system substrate-binding protein